MNNSQEPSNAGRSLLESRQRLLSHLRYTQGSVDSAGLMVIIGAPFDICGHRSGSRLGPPALRLAGLVEALTTMGYSVRDTGDLPLYEGKPGKGLAHFDACQANILALRDRVASALAEGEMPLVIGGDHTNGIGTVSGAMSHFGDDVAVLWVDAHADLNVPGTSPSGNLHGMPVAALLGHESGTTGELDTQWRRLLDDTLGGRFLRPDRIAWIGLRDVDKGERTAIRGLDGSFVATMYDVDRRSLVHCLEKFDAWMRASGAKQLWISFDVDSLDPVLAPGTGTAVRGGLTYREMHLMGEMLCEMFGEYRLCGLDVVETNPLFDTNNETARTAVEWIASLLGKTILG